MSRASDRTLWNMAQIYVYASIFVRFLKGAEQRKGPKTPRRSAAAATKFSTTDGHGLTRIKASRWAYSELRVRALRGEKVFSEMSDFGILHCKKRILSFAPSRLVPLAFGLIRSGAGESGDVKETGTNRHSGPTPATHPRTAIPQA
jgi:hypothetical protein